MRLNGRLSVITIIDGVVCKLFEGAIGLFPIEYCRIAEVEWLLSGPKRPQHYPNNLSILRPEYTHSGSTLN